MSLSTYVERVIRGHRGRAGAITRAKLLQRVHNAGFTDVTDRELRRIYADELSLPSWPHGIYWPVEPADLRAFEESIEHKYHGEFRRIAKVRERFAYLQGEQMELRFSA